VSWASTNTDVARVAPNGLVTAVAPGVVTITASSENTSATAVITVVAARGSVRRLALLGGGIALAGLAGALLLFHPFRPKPEPAAAGAVDSQAAGTRGADTQALVTSPSNPLPTAAETTVAPRATDSSKGRPERPGATLRDSSESTVATALAGARSARAMAVEAGAVQSDLAAGDAQLQQAIDMRRAGRRAAAFGHLRTATTLFSAAESTAAAAKIAAQRRAPPPDTTPKAAVPPPVTPAPPPVVDPMPAIRQSISAYIQAIEGRDLAAMTRMFPDIPPGQSEGWRQFFRGAEDVHATWQALRIAPSGDQADARVSMTLTFKRADNHSPDRRSTEFGMELSRRGDTWIITAVH
jgi:hypothetical protein